MSTEMQTATIIGGPASPFVRKVLAVCEMKGVPYRLDPIVPFFGNDAFGDISPLRRIPVFIDDQVSLCDSTVICEYLEDRYPTPCLLPGDPARRAQARWLEEFSDTRMADVFIWRVFYEAVILPFIFQKARDKEKIAKVVAEQVPEVMDYLETCCTRRRLSRWRHVDRRPGRRHSLRQPHMGARDARQEPVAQDLRVGRAHRCHDGAREGDAAGGGGDAGTARPASQGAGRMRRAPHRQHGGNRQAAPRTDVGLSVTLP